MAAARGLVWGAGGGGQSLKWRAAPQPGAGWPRGQVQGAPGAIPAVWPRCDQQRPQAACQEARSPNGQLLRGAGLVTCGERGRCVLGATGVPLAAPSGA